MLSHPSSRRALRLASLVVVATALCGAVRASTVVVRQDGSGDATTIQGGIALASAGDTVLVHPGTYSEAVLLNKAIVVHSVSGPAVTIVDAIGQAASAVTITGPANSSTVFEGFGVTRGNETFDAGGIAVVFSSPVVRGNIVYQNASHGMSSRGAGTPLFEGNFVTANSGSGYMNWATRSTLRNNQFVSNTEFGIQLYNDFPVRIEGNLISRNRLGGIEGVIPSSSSLLAIENNTIVRNAFGINLDYFANQVTLRRNIVVSNLRSGIRSGDPYSLHPTLVENDVWNNHAGDYLGTPVGPSDISANPVFCAPGALDFHIWWRSPCVLGAGAWIGAYGPGC